MELRLYDVGKQKEVVVAPIGDIQWAGKRRSGMIAVSALKDHVARCLDRDAWFIGMGDYIDFASPSNRKRLKGADLYDTAEMVLSDTAEALVEEVYDELLAPTQGRWLGLLEGHHFAQLETGGTSDHRLCAMLKAPFLGTSAIVGLRFTTPDDTKVFNIWAHHGAGGGQKAHAPLLKLENLLPYWDADLFLLGHMTKVAAAPIKRIHAAWNSSIPSLQERSMHIVGTGGWLKGFAEGAMAGGQPRGNYVEQKLLNPVALGAPVIVIRAKIDWINGGGGSRRRKAAGLPARRLWAPEVTVEV